MQIRKYKARFLWGWRVFWRGALLFLPLAGWKEREKEEKDETIGMRESWGLLSVFLLYSVLLEIALFSRYAVAGL